MYFVAFSSSFSSLGVKPLFSFMLVFSSVIVAPVIDMCLGVVDCVLLGPRSTPKARQRWTCIGMLLRREVCASFMQCCARYTKCEYSLRFQRMSRLAKSLVLMTFWSPSGILEVRYTSSSWLDIELGR